MDSSPEILDFDSSDENSTENSGIFLQQWDALVRPYETDRMEEELALPSIAVMGDQSSKLCFKAILTKPDLADKGAEADILQVLQVRAELKNYAEGPPLEPEGMGPYLKKIVYQHLADFIPMVIFLFILKEAAVMLWAHSMDLRDGADVVKLLVEDTEAGRKSADLHQCMERLCLAQECISIYL
ncbi:hypothetical protein cypCar_00041411 [Cyprinus carpio]|nr:hypothetical protein cypCar_00041411 [Cyprinus carpio]